MKLILGTAQFQNGYGITRHKFKIKKKEINEIFKLAKLFGIKLVDTAESYKINNFYDLRKNFKDMHVITKYQKFPSKNVYQSLKKKIKEDLKKFGVKKLYLLHFHNVEELQKNNSKEIIRSLKLIKSEDKLISKIGVSIYEPNELNIVLKIFRPDIVQIPLNILNQEFIHSGWIKRLKKMKIQIHIRSIFLQGLLLEKKGFLKKKYKPWSNELRKIDNYIVKKNIDLLYLSLNFIRKLKVSGILFSCENKLQLLEILKCYKKKINYKLNYNQFRNRNLNLIDPRKWKK